MSDLPKILVVEDQPLLLLDLIDNLAEAGFSPLSAGSARTAARLIDAGLEGLVTDIELGIGPDGLALARLAARHHPAMPIVVVSGGVQPRPDQLPSGAVFLPKPYWIADVVAALSRKKTARAA